MKKCCQQNKIPMHSYYCSFPKPLKYPHLCSDLWFTATPRPSSPFSLADHHKNNTDTHYAALICSLRGACAVTPTLSPLSHPPIPHPGWVSTHTVYSSLTPPPLSGVTSLCLASHTAASETSREPGQQCDQVERNPSHMLQFGPIILQ